MAEREQQSWRVEERAGEPLPTPAVLTVPAPTYWLMNGKEGFRMVSKFVAEMLCDYLNKGEKR